MGRSGSGLGMAIVWGTVKDHRGHVDVRSEEGQGTTFDLYFPMPTETPAMTGKRSEDSLEPLPAVSR